ncbi:hypothetical protein [Rhodococcoides kyotonense]|uniref:Uncharacterized protein n=1 Tax=Rhodococcoides kyotonense TaxID=398843 RepID=A0A239I8A2_9NOCA|nr:hypothetical protein [Rhodococcus kyotonensis]SNS89612.1 hypothetical protein SAMN05421642_106265 [Rhodococcus kyotonensis]
MSRRFSRVAGTVALSCAALLALPATAAADPAPSDPLSQALTTLQSQGAAAADPALAAATAIADSRTDVAETTDSNPLAALDAANEILTGLGITPFFYPTASINCAAVPGLPLDIAPAVAGAAGGPWPNIGLPAIPLLPQLPALNAVEKGETMFAFVPAGIVDDSGDKTGMQVAWFNVNTLKGGFADMGGATTTLVESILANANLDPITTEIARGALTNFVAGLPAAGARLAPVETGSGTVLAAVFGNVTHNTPTGEKSCFFFPTVGLIDVA